MKKVISIFSLLLITSVFLHADSDFEPGEAKVTVKVLNVRNISSAGGRKVGTLKRGALVNVFKRSKSQSTVGDHTDYWYKVKFKKKKKKKTGWVFGAFISFEVNLESGLKWKRVNPARRETFTGISVSSSGRIIAGTVSGNVFFSSNKGKSWRKIMPQALGNKISKIVKIILIKRVIWVASKGSSRGGLWKSKNNGKSWSQMTTSQGLLSNEVNDIKVTKRGYIYVATDKGISVSKNKGKTWKTFGPKASIGHKVISIAITKDGMIFAGTD